MEQYSVTSKLLVYAAVGAIQVLAAWPAFNIFYGVI